MKLSFLFVFLVLSFALKAQDIEREVLATAGETTTKDSLVLEWTLGEVIVGDLATDTLLLSQGFHQFFVEEVKLPDYTADWKVDIYPNPVPDKLIIRLSQPLALDIQIYDGIGKLITKFSSLQQEEHFISFDKMSSGLYILQLTDKEGQKRVFKIVKE